MLIKGNINTFALINDKFGNSCNTCSASALNTWLPPDFGIEVELAVDNICCIIWFFGSETNDSLAKPSSPFMLNKSSKSMEIKYNYKTRNLKVSLNASICLLVFFRSSLVTKKSKSKAGIDFWLRSKGFVSPLELQSNWTGGMLVVVGVVSLSGPISWLNSPFVWCLVGSKTKPSPEANIGTDEFLNYKKDYLLVNRIVFNFDYL